MFNKSKVEDPSIIEQLKTRITELENLLNQVANDNGSIIVKQLPNGKIELNGIEMDNTSEVEYYNSSQATYGELTLFRVGKEAKQREMDKLTKMHMDEVDELHRQINNLKQDIQMLEGKSQVDNDTIAMHEKTEANLQKRLDDKFKEIDELLKSNESEKSAMKDRYEGMIAGLEEDIQNWKQRYLTINNVTIDGAVITKYGEILGN